MVDVSLGERDKVVAGEPTGLPAQVLLGRLHQCIASTTCTAVLSCAVVLSESSGSSSDFKQHCVWIAIVPMSFVLLSESCLQRLDSRQQRARALPQDHCHAIVGQRFNVSVVPGDSSRSIVSVTFVFAMLGPRDASTLCAMKPMRRVLSERSLRR